MTSPSPISCFNCGYCIDGLEKDANCPECAFPIRSSLASHERVAGALFDPTLVASRFALLSVFQLVAALWLCLIPLLALSRNGSLPKVPSYVGSIALGAALVLWVCIQSTWHIIALLFTKKSAPFAANFLMGCSGAATVGLVLGGGLTLAVNQSQGSLGSALLPAALLLLGALASFIGTIPAAELSVNLTRTLPLSARAHLIHINWLPLVFTLCSVAAPFLAFNISPWFFLLLSIGPAFSFLRSFTLSRRIRAAISSP